MDNKYVSLSNLPLPPLSTCGPWGQSCLYSRVSIVGQGSYGCPQPIPTCSMVSTVQQHVDLVTKVLEGFKHWPSRILVKHKPLLESTKQSYSAGVLPDLNINTLHPKNEDWTKKGLLHFTSCSVCCMVLPKHVLPSLPSTNPCGHSHLKLPWLLIHWPFVHVSLSTAHSSISEQETNRF